MKQLTASGATDWSFRLGLLVNPLAGLGGTVALKGSDDVVAEALARGAQPQAGLRATAVLEALLPWRDHIGLFCPEGPMGAALAAPMGFPVTPVYAPPALTSAADTTAAAVALREAGVDLLLFAGGDGTARDICRAVGLALPVLGIPAGVKMQSGVFAVNPRGAAEIVRKMLAGEPVLVDAAEVRDIDEAALREGRIRSCHFGELRVPAEHRYLQQVKCNGHEVEALVLQEIAAEVAESLEPGTAYGFGPGTTPGAVMAVLGLPHTLLGVDVVRDGVLLCADATARQLEDIARQGPLKLVLTATGGQGMLLGRGNQQLTPAVLRAVGREGLIVVATHEKLKALAGRPLLLDIPDAVLAREFSGFVEVVTGYRSRVLYRADTSA